MHAKHGGNSETRFAGFIKMEKTRKMKIRKIITYITPSAFKPNGRNEREPFSHISQRFGTQSF